MAALKQTIATARTHLRFGNIAAMAAIVIALMFYGCVRPEKPPPSPYASAEQIEMNFRGQSFVLGNNDQIAIISAASGQKDRTFKLPFWLGVNILVPGVLQPKEGDYYVISEAVLVKPLDSSDSEWLIEAGSSLIKKETVLVTSRAHFRSPGKMLPMIVQFAGMRKFARGTAAVVEVPVLREVSLPMKWTLGGSVPRTYARFELR